VKSLGDQFMAIITPRLAKINEASEPVAVDIKDRMLVNTSEGRSFTNAPYFPTYTTPYANRAKGGNLKPVNLRGQNLGIETAKVVMAPTASTISFGIDGHILKYHHDGTARGGRVRTVFPKAIDQVPIETKQVAYQAGFEVLNG
jgi:hypothetical protein